MINEFDVKDWEMSPEALKLYAVKRNSIVSPVDDTNLLVNFSHVDGMYSYGKLISTGDVVHLAAWTDVFVWDKKLQSVTT